jgi:aminoglycoside phosphotransferase family enzyme
LRPEHVHLPPAPGRPLVIDRLEFNEALRQVDPFEEQSYLAVECRRLGGSSAVRAVWPPAE